MVRFELKKIFGKPSGKIALILLALLIGYSLYQSTADITYINEQGQPEYGITAIRKLRNSVKKWTGPLTTDKVREVIETNAAISAAGEQMTDTADSQNILYHQKQSYAGIHSMIIASYCPFTVYEYDIIDRLTPEDAASFYTNRVKMLSDWLDSDAAYQLTSAEKDFLLKQSSSLETPFFYDWTRGWQETGELFPALLMLLSLILGFLTAGIFSGEFQLGADSVFYASYHGRKKAIHAKLLAGFLIVSVLYWTSVLLCTTGILLIFGADGADCPVQVTFTYKNSMYNFTFFQQYLCNIFGGYVGCLFIQILTMYISAKTKSTVFAVTIPFLLIFVPSLLNYSSSSLILKLFGIMPIQLFLLPTAVCKFDFLYQIGSYVTGVIPIVLILYPLLTGILLPATYVTYKKKQIL